MDNEVEHPSNTGTDKHGHFTPIVKARLECCVIDNIYGCVQCTCWPASG